MSDKIDKKEDNNLQLIPKCELFIQYSLEMLNKFFDNPDNTMKEFLINHPEFIENSLNSDEKTRKRAKLLLDNNLYGI